MNPNLFSCLSLTLPSKNILVESTAASLKMECAWLFIICICLLPPVGARGEFVSLWPDSVLDSWSGRRDYNADEPALAVDEVTPTEELANELWETALGFEEAWREGAAFHGCCLRLAVTNLGFWAGGVVLPELPGKRPRPLSEGVLGGDGFAIPA